MSFFSVSVLGVFVESDLNWINMTISWTVEAERHLSAAGFKLLDRNVKMCDWTDDY